MVVSYWLGYQSGVTSGHLRFNSVSNLKQIGLAFRTGRNDFTGPFSITGVIAGRTSEPEVRQTAPLQHAPPSQ